jgi:Tfp pilus assembly protein PilO
VISFRTKAEAGTSIAILLALLTLVVTGIVMVFVPEPNAAGLAAGKIRSQRELEDRITNLKKDQTKAKEKIAKQVWALPIQEVGPKALESITAYAQKEKLKLVAFRPQKTAEVNGLTQLPFVISIEGPYPGIMKFLKDLDQPDLKLGTNLVQVSSSDPNTDLVSATVGVVAYKQLETKTATQEKPNAAKKEN